MNIPCLNGTSNLWIKQGIFKKTGAAYVITVLFLIFPYFVFADSSLCLGFTILNAVIVIFIFTFYISVAKGISFRTGFQKWY
jgi:VIT1/CCC1 family predicted Fe2+/Mn2+ transporter